ncbi:MAG: UDP-N-acetylglucosamine 2-epimerase (non-hydrolyzing) [Sphingomonas sp.]|nr:UDP-N-acetylglucosamine 2-epimerase (non-hydrolyzing) [Sphingomonas sp.]
MRLLSVIGTRPEAVKMAPVLLALAAEPGVDSRLCVTGQHRELLDDVLRFFDLAPDVDLDLMTPGQELNALISTALHRLDAVLAEIAPDRVIVQGDTSTAYAAALAAHHRGIPVAHVEAGLRTYAANPWPEEANRRAITLLADLHLAPTPVAAANLAAERVRGRIVVTGNSGIDALHMVLARCDAARDTMPDLPADRRLILFTGHRREHFGTPFDGIWSALREIAKRPDVAILCSVHPNPRIRDPITVALGDAANIRLVPPLSLAAFARTLRRADLVLTDSGGVQEEAAALGRPTLVLRDATERNEGIAAGLAVLVGSDPARIVSATMQWLDRPPFLAPSDVYGDGRAAGRIVDALLGHAIDEFAPEARDRPTWIG